MQPDNVGKIESLDWAIHGQHGQPGLNDRVARHESDLYGDGRTLGLMQKVSVMWKIHWWIACAVSAVIGAIGTEMFHRIFHP